MSGDSSSEQDNVIANLRAGKADDEELNEAIAVAWREALADTKERTAIAQLLGAQESELNPEVPPFYARSEGAGSLVAEMLILLAATFSVGFAKGFGTSLGGAAGKRAAKALGDLWNHHLHDRVNPLGSGRIGRAKSDPKDDSDDKEPEELPDDEASEEA